MMQYAIVNNKRRHFSVTTARKIWTCNTCGKPIEKGERYTHSADSPSGRNERRDCQKCKPAVEAGAVGVSE